MDHLWGFISILFEPNAAVFFWHKAGYSLWLTYVLLSLPTSFTIMAVFWGAGWLKKRKKLKKYLSAVPDKIEQTLRWVIRYLPFWKKASGYHGRLIDKLVKILKRRGIIVIFIASCIPFLPIVPTATAIAAKLLEIKHGLIVILLGTAIRNILLVLGIYYGISLFFPD